MKNNFIRILILAFPVVVHATKEIKSLQALCLAQIASSPTYCLKNNLPQDLKNKINQLRLFKIQYKNHPLLSLEKPVIQVALSWFADPHQKLELLNNVIAECKTVKKHFSQCEYINSSAEKNQTDLEQYLEAEKTVCVETINNLNQSPRYFPYDENDESKKSIFYHSGVPVCCFSHSRGWGR